MIEILKDYGKQNITIKSVARVLGQLLCPALHCMYMYMYMYTIHTLNLCLEFLDVCLLSTFPNLYSGMMAATLTGLPDSVPFMVCTALVSRLLYVISTL